MRSSRSLSPTAHTLLTLLISYSYHSLMAPVYLRPDRDNWLEKLNEWNDKRRALQWNDAQRKTADGTWKWFSTPSLREMDITDCIGVGASKSEAREVAAKMLSDKSKLWI